MGRPSVVSFASGRGGHVWDHDGRRYIDWICGYGPVVLGHGDERVADAVHRQLLAGTLLPGGSAIEDSLSERLLALFPGTESCVFLKTGSEAAAHPGRDQDGVPSSPGRRARAARCSR